MNPPYIVENERGASDILLLCDHAVNDIPADYGDLGLSVAARHSHIAWDIGALAVARGLSRRLDAALIYPTASRLLIDCNRAPSADDLIAAASDKIPIPGNRDLDAGERTRRLAQIHAPYHDRIAALINNRYSDLGAAIARIISIHSFTPIMDNETRPWHAGILFDKDNRLATTMIAALQDEGLNVEANVPYDASDGVYWTVGLHAETRGLYNVVIEIRNDLIDTEAGQQIWIDRLSVLLA